MKKLIILFFSIFSLFSYSQEDFKKKIAQDACKCIGEIKLEKKSKEMMQMQLGLCFIKVSTPYKEQIKKDTQRQKEEKKKIKIIHMTHLKLLEHY